ncbi:MAG TPA: glutamine amidotransferase, partial [Bryobacteraceae bacterium]|nr:glutamine amidotransferase [Bryobacteraceae bacterium]
MFEFLFKYPSFIFHKGRFVLLAPLPVWILVLAILAAAALLFWHVRRHHGLLTGSRPLAIWLLETALVALVLFLLWHPALSVATLRPQQNVVAVLVDDSHSRAIQEGSRTRLAEAEGLLKSNLLDALGKRFQLRLYRFGRDLERIQRLDQLAPNSPATHIGDSLQQVLAESSTLPLGAVVLLSDGADNSGGIDLETVSQIRSRHIPIHTIGFGREKLDNDLEVTDVIVPARTLADSRLSAVVTFRQSGHAGQKAHLTVRDGDRVLAAEDITLKPDGVPQTEALVFNSGSAGPKTLRIGADVLANEENHDNNVVTRLVNVEGRRPRLLYIEGEPRWEYKFIRRAIDDDHTLLLSSMLRTTQNKIYRQGLADGKELQDGFPAKAEELFAYDGLVIGSVEASYFTSSQQELIREFANRRGGGILFLAGRYSLGDGGYQHSPLAELLPVRLSDSKNTFHRDEAAAELTAAGNDSILCRLAETPQRNAERWKKMPLLMNYQEVGEAKPGAVTLMQVSPQGRRATPLLVTQNYGRGRTAVFATAGSWRWRMLQDHNDTSHVTFWQQLFRFLVAETPGQLISSTPRPVLSDENRVQFRAEVRDKSYNPAANAHVEARILTPEGRTDTVELTPKPLEEGVYVVEYTAVKPGSYVAEVVARNGQEEI